MNIGTMSNIDLVHYIKALANVNSMLKTQPDPNDECQFEIQDSAGEESKQETQNSDNGKWINGSLFKIDLNSSLGYTADRFAINKVREKLKSEGVDPDYREPTYGITDEQLEWLSGRHDFGDSSAWDSMQSSEFGNFVLDLAYLNVLSFDDVETLFGVLEFNANHRCTEFVEGKGYANSDGSYSEKYEEFIAKMNTEYLAEKSPEKPVEEIEKTISVQVKRHFELMSLLDSFFAQLREYSANDFDTIKPFITDFSEKLKEDFGARQGA